MINFRRLGKAILFLSLYLLGLLLAVFVFNVLYNFYPTVGYVVTGILFFVAMVVMTYGFCFSENKKGDRNV